MTINFDGFDVVALLVYVTLIAAAFVIIVEVGGLPGRIARLVGNPQATAITAAGWISLVSGGLLWPIAFIWAFLKPSPVSSVPPGGPEAHPEYGKPVADLHARINTLEAGLRALQNQKEHLPWSPP
jgi:hypothetical protein